MEVHNEQRNAQVSAEQSMIDRRRKRQEKLERRRDEAEQFAKRQRMISGLGNKSAESPYGFRKY